MTDLTAAYTATFGRPPRDQPPTPPIDEPTEHQRERLAERTPEVWRSR